MDNVFCGFGGDFPLLKTFFKNLSHSVPFLSSFHFVFVLFSLLFWSVLLCFVWGFREVDIMPLFGVSPIQYIKSQHVSATSALTLLIFKLSPRFM